MIEENVDKWRAKAVAEGMLLEKFLIKKRFGPISRSTHARLTGATEAQLQPWADRILDAHSLAEVFSDH